LMGISGHKQWGVDALQMVGDRLYEPLVEDGIGVTRTGVTDVFILEFQGAGQSCGRLQSTSTNHFSTVVCVTVKVRSH
jgi:hypothetical protein